MGQLIVIDGLDGSGKATQTQFLFEKLLNVDKNTLHISFPNYDDDSSVLVKMYLNGELGSKPDSVNAYAASSFYAVDRYVSYKKYWEDKYLSGFNIICDRYVTSNLIHQMSKLETSDWDDFINWVSDYEYNKLSLPKPNKVIYLDLDIDTSQKLINKRCNDKKIEKDIHENDINYLKKCRKAAYYIAEKENWNIVSCCDDDGNMFSKKDLSNRILQIVTG